MKTSNPEIKIFERRNKILKQALDGALEQTNLDGGFYSYNDALKEKTFISNEITYSKNTHTQTDNPLSTLYILLQLITDATHSVFL